MDDLKLSDPDFHRTIGSLGGKVHLEKAPEYFRDLGRRGAAAFKRKMQDEDFRENHIRLSREGRERAERV
jgi:hypothetical protein